VAQKYRVIVLLWILKFNKEKLNILRRFKDGRKIIIPLDELDINLRIKGKDKFGRDYVTSLF